MEQLKLPSNSCIAIEDYQRGIDSARGAGLNVIVTPSMYTTTNELRGASLIVSDLGEQNKPFKVIYGEVFNKEFIDLDFLRDIHESLKNV